jgi:uncharacterized protein YoxC
MNTYKHYDGKTLHTRSELLTYADTINQKSAKIQVLFSAIRNGIQALASPEKSGKNTVKRNHEN